MNYKLEDMSKVLIYNKVFDRENPGLTDFETFFFKPQELMKRFSDKSLNWVIGVIKRTKDKEYRNWLKRNYLPVVKLYPEGVLSIDIDDLLGDAVKIQTIVESLRKDEYCLGCKGTPSKNLVAFYKFDCSKEDFPYLFYKKYLELTLALSVNIDFLPERDRLRYISNGDIHFYNPDSKVLTGILKVDKLPFIFNNEPMEVMEDEDSGEKPHAEKVKVKIKKKKLSKRTFIYNS